jgi:hypothetical protein
MAKVTKAYGAQWPLTVAFNVNATDTMVNTSSAEVAFGAVTSGTNTTYDLCTMPPNSVVIGGRVIVGTVFNSTANSVDLGDSDDLDRYTETGAIDLKVADAPATGFDLLGDGKIYDGSQSLRATFTNTVAAATAGRAIIVVTFVILGRANENLKTS